MHFSCLEIAFGLGSQQLQSILQALQAVAKDVGLHNGLVRGAREETRAQELDHQSVCSLEWEIKYFSCDFRSLIGFVVKGLVGEKSQPRWMNEQPQATGDESSRSLIKIISLSPPR